VIITNPLRSRATEMNQKPGQSQLQPQVVATARAIVSGSRSIHRLGYSDMTRLVFAKCRLLEVYM
jgi:hypothetical protein